MFEVQNKMKYINPPKILEKNPTKTSIIIEFWKKIHNNFSP